MKLRNYRKRVGRCYELSWKTVMDNAEWCLVHGEVCGQNQEYIGHAWLEKDDEVYDPVLNEFMTFEAYRVGYAAFRIQKYSAEEAAVLMLKEKHFGPW